MGSFIGHALPGSFFLIFSVWWTIGITRRIVACRNHRKPFYNTITYPYFCLCRSEAPEAVFKMVACSVGMVGELLSSLKPLYRAHQQHRTVSGLEALYVGDIQHVSMYLFFFLSGLVDILMQRHGSLIPRGTDYVIGSLAFVVEGLLFSSHLNGRDALDVTLHTLLVYVVAGCALVTLAEAYYDESSVCAYVRAFLTMLQGTWFYQVAFILYPPGATLRQWGENGHEDVMVAVVVFSFHLLLVFFLMSVISGLTYLTFTRVISTTQFRQDFEEMHLDSDTPSDDEQCVDIQNTAESS